VLTGPGVPEAPKHPDVHCKSPHAAVLSWDEPCGNGAPISEYRLEWQAKDAVDFIPVQFYYNMWINCDIKHSEN